MMHITTWVAAMAVENVQNDTPIACSATECWREPRVCWLLAPSDKTYQS